MRKPITLAIMAAIVGAGGVLASSFDSFAAAPSGGSRVLLAHGALAPDAKGATLLHDYGGFALYRVDDALLGRLRSAEAPGLASVSDAIGFVSGTLDTDAPPPAIPAAFQSGDAGDAPRLAIVQYVGPIAREWIRALTATGARIVQFVPENAYVVQATPAQLDAISHLARAGTSVRYVGAYQPWYKLSAALAARAQRGLDPAARLPVTVQVVSWPGNGPTKAAITQLAGAAAPAWQDLHGVESVRLEVAETDLVALAQYADVFALEEYVTPVRNDEVQDQIVAGNFNADMSGPVGPGYFSFLAGLGFSTVAADYPIVNVTDDGIGDGTTVNGAGDVTLTDHEDGATSRILAVANCTGSGAPHGKDGHGHLNTGIVGGYDARSGFPYVDNLGYLRGTGINPYARLAHTKIFADGGSYNISSCGGTDAGVSRQEVANGGVISTNSWGAPVGGAYNADARAYDIAVRDADNVAAGQQPMIYVFSAGNDGPGAASIGAPGTAKNVITVGASENQRPSDEQGSWTDGCAVGPTGADNAMDTIGFSSRGPAQGNRTKPEVTAPGTHIQASASVYSGYDGSGVCDRYRPNGGGFSQTTFAASSGTSHSTPATAGVVSLAYWWIEHGGAGAAAGLLDEIGGSRAPSPALSKAWLMAHPTYLTGVSGNGNLPTNAQGYGMPNLSLMFDTTPKVLLDQSEVMTASGDTRSYTWGIADPTRPVRITMAYSDAPGATNGNPQVNNLDLTVEVGGQTYRGNHFGNNYSTTGGSADAANNYEAVFLPAGTSGDATITVTATNVAADGTGSGSPSQDFALVCSNCSQNPSFTLAAAQTSLEVCAGGAGQGTLVHLGQITGFSDPVTLALDNPAGTDAIFDPNPAVPPADSSLAVSAQASAVPGDYPLTLSATSGSLVKTLGMDLEVFAEPPAQPGGELPADGSTGVALTPTFSWEAAEGGYTYLVQVATDPAFANIVRSHETASLSWTPDSGETLDSSARYWWRVIARNACGDSAGGAEPPPVDRVFADGFDPAAAGIPGQEFTTLAMPGDCPVDTAPTVLFSADMENGAGGWTHGAASGSTDTWTLAGEAAHGGSFAWQATPSATAGTGNDQWLVSPAVALPGDLSALSLKFWNRQHMAASSSGCYDGGLIEVSTDGGTSWTQVTNGLLTDPYDGAISGGFGNPLGGDAAWCGDPQAYLDSIVDLQPYAGQNVKFRFRLGHDRIAHHRSGINWAIDDVKVTGCSAP
jgi:subtilase family protein